MREKVTSTTFFALMILAALALQTNTAKGGQLVKDGLISYWTFDEADMDGDTVKDTRGNNDGEIIGDRKTVDGKVGNGLEFNGVDDNVKVSSLDISPGVYPTVTAMAWVYPTSTGEGGQGSRRFVFGTDDGGWDRGLLMQSTNWRVGTGNDGTDYWDTGATVDLNTWQHLAIVYDAEDIKFYKDGVEYSYGSPGDVGAGNPFLIIGGYPIADRARFFKGIIDEACVYDRALNGDEIRQNMDATEIAVEKSNKLSITWGEVKAVR